MHWRFVVRPTWLREVEAERPTEDMVGARELFYRRTYASVAATECCGPVFSETLRKQLVRMTLSCGWVAYQPTLGGVVLTVPGSSCWGVHGLRYGVVFQADGTSLWSTGWFKAPC